MSLKAFHLVFISLSVLMILTVLGWAAAAFFREPRLAYLAYGSVCLASGVGLIAYARYFLRKLKNISYL